MYIAAPFPRTDAETSSAWRIEFANSQQPIADIQHPNDSRIDKKRTFALIAKKIQAETIAVQKKSVTLPLSQ